MLLKRNFLVLIGLFLLLSCATTPKTPEQTLYAAGWTLVGATNSVADLHQSGVLVGQDYQNAKDILQQAEAAYKVARDSIAAGNPANASTYIALLQSLLLQLSAFLQAHGGK